MICAREDELLDALRGGWLGAELEEHVAGCGSCRELHAVAGAVLRDCVQAVAEAPVPNAGTMWWRLQLRHRQEVQALARRSLLIGQAATLAIALTVAITVFGSLFAVEVRAFFAALPALATIRLTPVLAILAAWTLLAPIGGFIAIRQK
jgi:predicted anti-sigma-YlaC factor YlaD